MSERAPTRREASATLKPLFVSFYLPCFLIVVGQGAILPVLAIAAKNVGASTSVASFVVALNGFGTFLFDIPSGRIVARFGEIASGRVAALLLFLGLLGALFSSTPIELGASIFVLASGWSVWSLARLTYLSRVAPPNIRGRALSLFGGIVRAGQVVGPFLLAAVVSAKSVKGAFIIYMVAAAIGFVWISLARDRRDTAAVSQNLQQINPLKVIADNRGEFLSAGVGTFTISMLRASRQVVIPLWGLHLGLSPSKIALVFGVSSIVDMCLFYPSGVISDRWGRKAVAVPCIAILSIGHIVLPLSHSYDTLFLASMLISFGNGMGSGIVMTMGADRAPEVGRSSFLAVWRAVSDGGTTIGPLIESVVIAGIGLAFAAPTIGVLGLLATYRIARHMHDPVLVAESRRVRNAAASPQQRLSARPRLRRPAPSEPENV